ncbi:MAG TPA: hypothetical protein ENI39_00075 [Anaerolineae bacterium]|nr:hypothetical protein [Anaerolineae bacterium]
MNKRLLYLYCRAKVEWNDLKRRPALRETVEGEAGLSKLAITVILVGVGVALTLAVVAILGPAIMGLAQRVGVQIESAPLDWGE